MLARTPVAGFWGAALHAARPSEPRATSRRPPTNARRSRWLGRTQHLIEWWNGKAGARNAGHLYPNSHPFGRPFGPPDLGSDVFGCRLTILEAAAAVGRVCGVHRRGHDAVAAVRGTKSRLSGRDASL